MRAAIFLIDYLLMACSPGLVLAVRKSLGRRLFTVASALSHLCYWSTSQMKNSSVKKQMLSIHWKLGSNRVFFSEPKSISWG